MFNYVKILFLIKILEKTSKYNNDTEKPTKTSLK